MNNTLYTTDFNKGPFGNYEGRSVGKVINALHHFGLPMRICDSVTVSKEGLYLYGEPFATHQWFDDVYTQPDVPLFHFHDRTYASVQGYFGYQPTLSDKGTLGLEFYKTAARPPVYDSICALLNNKDMRSDEYKATQAAGAFFQSGSDNRNGEYFFVEFWKQKGAVAWCELFTKNYRQRVVDYAGAFNV